MRPLLAVLLLLSAAAAQEGKEARFDSLLDNSTVAVDSIEIPPGFHAPVFQNSHDVIWIAMTPGALSFTPSEGATQEISFHPGDTRVFRSFQARSVENRGALPARAVVVELKARGQISPGCFCGSSVEKAVCGCADATPLPDLWAVGVGTIMLSGSTLDPGQGYRRGMRRDDMVLVAISAAQLRDDIAPDPAAQSINLKPGEVRWIPAGTHQLRNAGDAPAKLVTIEF